MFKDLTTEWEILYELIVEFKCKHKLGNLIDNEFSLIFWNENIFRS